uniref:DUF659 domain-containing protein n=1 Tax=Lactuca sativa TaxID=4236 RepID=A0A9R1XNE9_LACSA|nr:hypothetical protein LSAT_V11C400175830 [Lactuca sativa]
MLGDIVKGFVRRYPQVYGPVSTIMEEIGKQKIKIFDKFFSQLSYQLSYRYNFSKFITDNGSNYKVARKVLEEQHPKLLWTPCATYCVKDSVNDLMYNWVFP